MQMVKLALAVLTLHLASTVAAAIPPAFAIGTAFGFVSDSPDAMACAGAFLGEEGEFKQAIQDIEKGIKHRNITELKDALQELEAAIKGGAGVKAACKKVETDVKAIVGALKQIHGAEALALQVVNNFFDDGEKIFGELAAGAKSYKTKKDYMTAGQQTGMALRRMLVGEAAPNPPSSTTTTKPPAPGYRKSLAIGAALGFVSDTPDVMGCAMSLLGEEGDVKQALDDIEKGIKHRNMTEIQDAFQELEAAIKGAPGVEAACKKVEMDVKAIVGGLKQIHNAEDLVLQVVNNLFDDSDKIFAELAAADHAYKTGWDYMTAGQQTGMALRRMLVGEVMSKAAVLV